MGLYSTLIQAKLHLCNKHYGPAGQTNCVLLRPYYQEYQCATCLTNSYIQLKSARRDQCRDTTATYCWYQCQIELFGNDAGEVNEKCRCKAGEMPSSSKTPLPTTCYSPSGTDCEWYQDCLERRFPCVGTSADYAMKYAAHFCAAYSRNYNQFSSLGKIWVDAVRKCLQVSLAPLLRECNSGITCEFIQDTAFKSHDCCYLAGAACTPRGTPSICDISFFDWITVFMTIKDSFIQSQALETFQSGLHVGFNCIEKNKTNAYKYLQKTIEGWIRNLQLEFRNPKKNVFRKKRSSDNDQFQQNDMFAVALIDQLSRQLNWDKTKLSWFAFSPNTTKNKLANASADYFSVNVILVDKFAKASGIKNSTLLNNTISNFIDNMKKGNIKQIGNIVLKTAFDCQDILCGNATEYKVIKTNSSSPIPPQSNSANTKVTTKTHFMICFFFTVITLRSAYCCC